LGNDVNDLAPMGLVGWPVAVADAHPTVRQAARLVLARSGGHGAVRELCDLIVEHCKRVAVERASWNGAADVSGVWWKVRIGGGESLTLRTFGGKRTPQRAKGGRLRLEVDAVPGRERYRRPLSAQPGTPQSTAS
jgi:hypothetical protein